MFRRQLAKLQRYAILLLSYLTVYCVVWYAIAPTVTVSFVGDTVRVGDKFVLIYLVAPEKPAFADTDGAEVFQPCGKCFVTNNKGFMPLWEYDAVLTVDGRGDAAPGDNSYVLEVTDQCVGRKLKGCVKEPRITSLATKEVFNLCGLCRHLHFLRTRNK